MDIENLKYPVGKFSKPEMFTSRLKAEYIEVISMFPNRLRDAIANLNDSHLDTPYRPGGWTIRQVVNHCSDSHMNAMIRFKLALTEDKPVITPYLQNAWANLADSKTMPLEAALNILEGLHSRWTVLLQSMSDSDFEKCYVHPEHGREIRLTEALASYAWHCNHHLAHVVNAVALNGW